MSGHSKWASIKHKKAAADAKRSNVFTKLGNDVTVAARRGGGDPAMNPTLRVAIDKARGANMPKDNIERAVKRGTGELGGAAVEELLYEGFGPGNTAMLVEVLTDNRNRANADIRQIFVKHSGRFAEGGGVAYQFTQRGLIRLEVPADKVDLFEELTISEGADDYLLEDNFAVVYVPIASLHHLKDAYEKNGLITQSAAIEHVPNTPIEIAEEDMEKVSILVDLLEEYDDVTNVYTNIA